MNIVICKTNGSILPRDPGYGGMPSYLTKEGFHTSSGYATEHEFLKIIYWMIIAKGHKKILEIGTNEGHCTYWLLKAAEKTGGAVVTVDPEDHYKGIESPLLTRATVTSLNFFQSLKKDETFDFIYVDGDHTFISAYFDMLNAERFIAPGGTIAVHDTRYNEGLDNYQTDKALLELMRDTKGQWLHYPCGHGLSIGEF